MEKVKDFVAIDFETLQAVTLKDTPCYRMPIQIGMVKYMNGEQVGDVFSCYIDPPVAKPWASYFKIAITSENCEGAKTFDVLYPEILDFIGDLPLVAFSCTTEVNAFQEACEYYELDNPFPKSRFIDPYYHCLSPYKHPTKKSEFDSGLSYWFGYFGLSDGLYLQHQAGYDALMCAKLYLHLQTVDVDALLEKRPPHPAWFQKKDVKKDLSLFGDPIPEEEVLHPENPLNRKYVCVTGFECEIENSLNAKLKLLGAGRHDDVKKGRKGVGATNILVPSRSYIERYASGVTSKFMKTIKENRYIMFESELKEILQTYDMYEGEFD